MFFDRTDAETLWSENTYNRDCILSKTLQYAMFNWQDETFVLLEMHNGADVRGGYSAPKVFSVRDEDQWYCAQSNLGLGCDCFTMYSDEYGYRWYPNDAKSNFPEMTWEESDDFPDQWKAVPVDPEKTDRWHDHDLICDHCKTKVEVHAYLEY
jgi:hypothetical protein